MVAVGGELSYSVRMKVALYCLGLVAVLVSFSPAAADPCRNLEEAQAALDAARAVRKNVEALVDASDDALQEFPEEERKRVIRHFKTTQKEIESALFAAYSGYMVANVAVQDAARRAVAAADLSEDSAIMAAITLNGATVELIDSIVPKKTAPFPYNRREKRLVALDSVIDGFLKAIAAVACK